MRREFIRGAGLVPPTLFFSELDSIAAGFNPDFYPHVGDAGDGGSNASH
jgi:hypothetical protein